MIGVRKEHYHYESIMGGIIHEGNAESANRVRRPVRIRFLKIETSLGIHHAVSARKSLILMAGSFALSIVLFLTLCVYGFLLIIALVTLLNIMNSIFMSVSARSRQYGAMRAVGMDGWQMTKMIAAETATYALSGCFIGCAVGLAFYRGYYCHVKLKIGQGLSLSGERYPPFFATFHILAKSDA